MKDSLLGLMEEQEVKMNGRTVRLEERADKKRGAGGGDERSGTNLRERVPRISGSGRSLEMETDSEQRV